MFSIMRWFVQGGKRAIIGLFCFGLLFFEHGVFRVILMPPILDGNEFVSPHFLGDSRVW
jgi:hypothetical protein